MKKTIMLSLLCFLLLLSLQPAARAESGQPQLIVSTETALPGETVTLSVSVQNNPGFMVINPKLDFDRSRLEMVGFEDAGLTGWTATDKAAVWLGDNDSTFEGVILLLRFRVLDDAADGFAAVRLICGEGDCYNYDEQAVFFDLISGGVQIGEIGHVHTQGPEVIENSVPPTCTKDGHEDSVVFCEECGAELLRFTRLLPASGHHYKAPVFQWNDDLTGASAVFICSQNDDVLVEEADISSQIITKKDSGEQVEEIRATVVFQGQEYTDVQMRTIQGQPETELPQEEPAQKESPTPEPEKATSPAPDQGSDDSAAAETDGEQAKSTVSPILLFAICAVLAAAGTVLYRSRKARK